MTDVPVKPISELEEKSEVSVNDKILILDSVSEEARLAPKSELKGDKGDKGDKWDKGDKGATGAKWDKWDKGDTWAKGDKWDKWDTWAVWPAWAKWDKGDKWDTGAKWDTWAKWEKGDKGATWNTWPAWADGKDWVDGADWNWITSVTSSKSWKTTTVTMNFDEWDPYSFEVQDWADWQWAWDVLWPSSAIDGHLAVFDWATWKLIKDGWAIPEWDKIEYVTQAEYTALLPWAASDGKHYFIYTISGWWGWWTPDPTRTIFYYNFEDSNNRLADSSGNNNDATSVTSITYTQVWNEWVAETTGTPNWIHIPSNIVSSIWTWDYALSFWCYTIDPWSWKSCLMVAPIFSSNPYFFIVFDPRNVFSDSTPSWDWVKWCWPLSGWYMKWSHSASSLYDGWHHFVMTRISGTVYWYIDAELDVSYSSNFSIGSNSGDGSLLWRYNSSGQSFWSWAKWDKFIFENVGWTATDVTNYYNLTKADYWVS